MKKALMFLFVFMLVFVPGSLIMSGCILTDLYWSVEGGNDIQGFDRVEAPTGEVNTKNGKTYIGQGSTKVLEFYFDWGWDIAEEDRDNFVMLNGNYHSLRTDALSSKYRKVYSIYFDYQYKHKVKVTFNKNVEIHKLEMPVKMVWRGDGDAGSVMPYDITVAICNMTESELPVNEELALLNQTEEVLLEDTVYYGQKYQIDVRNRLDSYYNLDMIELEYPEGGGAGASTLTKTVDNGGTVTYDLILERDTVVVFSQKKFDRLRQNINFEYIEGEYEMVKGALELFSFTKEDDTPVMISDFYGLSTINLKVKCNLIDDPRFEGCYDNLFNTLTINGKTLEELEITTPTITDGVFVIPIKRPYMYFGAKEYIRGLGDRFTNYRRIVFSADCISRVLAKGNYRQTELTYSGDFDYDLGSARYIAINTNIIHNSTPYFYDACKENKQEIVFAKKGRYQYFFPLESEDTYAGMRYFFVVDLPNDMHFTYLVGDGQKSRYHYVYDDGDFSLKLQYCEGGFYPDPYYNSVDNDVYIMIDSGNILNAYGSFAFGAEFNNN